MHWGIDLFRTHDLDPNVARSLLNAAMNLQNGEENRLNNIKQQLAAMQR